MALTKALDGEGTGWGSHQPALRALAEFMKIDSVIEFGAGLYSTHLFLDLEAFPDLTSLVTFEHKNDWAEKVRVNDQRHKLIIIPAQDFLNNSKGMNSDFIFLDCAPSKMRFELLPQALTMAPIVGIHDTQIHDVDRFKCKYIRGFNSIIQTVFVSNEIDLSALEIK